tara:strand:+ start:627 stop:1664 length:1038 start_codon:yes stop_codon:yes gene_type:complete
MAINQQNNEEEVDLGSLFVIIGKGFSNLFNFIGNLFKGVFHFLIIILLFLKQHLLPIGIAALLGLTAGYVIEVKTPKRYTSDLLLQTNFKSSRQLYDNIGFYNNLVKQRDTFGLEQTFGLDKQAAASLKKFTITPIKNQNDIISGYNELILKADTAAVRNYKFEDFEESFSDFDFKLHEITVIAEKNSIFKGIGDVIITSVVKNEYFNTLKNITNENLNRLDSRYRQNLVQLDSFGNVFMRVLLAGSKKVSNGTNIDFAGENRSAKEIEIFYTNQRVNELLEEVAAEKLEKNEIINIVSNFESIGNEINGVTENKAFQLAALFALATILVLLFLKLNRYLNNYKR